MIRITKSPDERKNEILEAAMNLFFEKGFQKTAVSDIVKKLGIAQGTFYYYFKSKEEVLDEIIHLYVEMIIKSAIPIVEDKSLNAIDKMKKILMIEFNVNNENETIVFNLHSMENLDIHQKIFSAMVKTYAPILVKVIEQGNKERLLNTKYPLESVEVLFVGFHFMFEIGIMSDNVEEFSMKFRSAGEIVENTLSAKKGSFGFLPGLLEENLRRFYEHYKNPDKK